MNPKVEFLERLSAALTRGQGSFTKDDLAAAFEEVYGLLIQGQLGNLVLEGHLDLWVREGKIFYSAAKGKGSDEAMSLEMMIENMRS